MHRDLGPGSVRVTPDGCARIPDFGRARHSTALNSHCAAGTQSASSRTRGCVADTVIYVSSEQGAGQTADARSDLLSFGVVPCELVNEQPATRAAFRTSSNAS